MTSIEIGSFFQLSLDLNINRLIYNYNKFSKNNFFISGRVGIKYIINNLKKKNINKYLLPNYLCESIIQNFHINSYNFYEINNKFEINIENLENIIIKFKPHAIFIINYFGIIDKNLNNIITLCKNYNILIIEDNTHNIYDKYNYGDIVLSSFRKTLPTPFGCIIYDKNNLLEKQSNKISYKNLFLNLIKILGMILKKICFFKSIWYNLLLYSENKLNNVYEYNFDYINFLFFIIYYNENNINIRINNFKILKNSVYKPIVDNIYFSYPIIFDSFNDREIIRKKLIKNKIYPIIYWPLDFDKEDKCNHNISDRILSIPIDERYNNNDMYFILKILNK
jgi:hypothetical protein